MGKVKLEEAVKELHRMSKRMVRISKLFNNLSHVDDEFNKKADELMASSLICDSWADNIFNEFIIEKKE